MNDLIVRSLAAAGAVNTQWSISSLYGKRLGNTKGIFGFGTTGGAGQGSGDFTSNTNLVSNTGVVASDTAGVGTARHGPSAASFGDDKVIFGFGLYFIYPSIPFQYLSMTNLVSNTGVVAADTAGVGSGRYGSAAAGYGRNKAIFGFGQTAGPAGSGGIIDNKFNLVSNTGVVASDMTSFPYGSPGGRRSVAAASFGGDQVIFAYGYNGNHLSVSTLVSNTGVIVQYEVGGVGTARSSPAAAGYGGDKAIFGFGGWSNFNVTNLVSNTGVVAADTAGVGTGRYSLAAAQFGTDKAIFGYGWTGNFQSMTNLVSNTGVVASDTAGVGTAREGLAAASYGA